MVLTAGISMDIYYGNIFQFLEWTKEAYSFLDTIPYLNPIDYVDHVLYATVWLETKYSGTSLIRNQRISQVCSLYSVFA